MKKDLCDTEKDQCFILDCREDRIRYKGINEIVIDLVIANEYKLNNYLATFMAKEFHFISLIRTFVKAGLVNDKILKRNMAIFLNSYSLPKEISYELVKNSIKILFHEVDEKNLTFLDRHKQHYAEMISILNFFDNVFYDDNVIDISPKNKKGKIFSKAFQYSTNNVIRKITCDAEDFVDRATLIIEDKRIHVKSFILTDNSPVFKTMLHSTSFKEGQTKTIELPGKSLDEVVYFLEFLQYPKQIDGKSFNFFIYFALWLSFLNDF